MNDSLQKMTDGQILGAGSRRRRMKEGRWPLVPCYYKVSITNQFSSEQELNDCHIHQT